MKKILLFPLFLLSLLSAMEGPTKKARVDVPASSETAQPLSTPLTEQESDTNKVKSLKELATEKFLKTADFSHGFPQGFYELPFEMQEYLMTKPIPNRMGRTWLHEAKTTQDIDNFIQVNPQGVNKQDDLGNTAFNSFIQSGRLDLAKYLLTKSPHLHVMDNTKLTYPLNMAIRFRDTDLGLAIIEHIKKIPDSELTKQYRNVFAMNLAYDVAMTLPEAEREIKFPKIAQQIKINLLNYPENFIPISHRSRVIDIRTTVQLALMYKLPRIIYALELLGISLDPSPGRETNPMILLMDRYEDSQFKEVNELLEHLLSLGIDINSTDHGGRNALITLLGSLNPKKDIDIQKLIQLLVKHGLDINHADEDGDSALAYAAIYYPQAIPTLIELGADETKLNNDNDTALDYLNANNPEFVPLYEEALKKRAIKLEKEQKETFDVLEQFLLEHDTGTSQ